MKFAKLFELGEEQVLITKDYTTSHEIKFHTSIGGVLMVMTWSIPTEEVADKFFDSQTLELVEQWRNTVIADFLKEEEE